MAEADSKPPALSPNRKMRKIQIEEAAAKKDAAVAAARKAKVEANKAAADPEPEPKSKAPEGKIELGDDVGLVADLVAHSMLDEAADELSKKIVEALNKGNSGTSVLLVDSPDLLGSDWPYMAISTQLAEEKAGLDSLQATLAEAAGEELRPSQEISKTTRLAMPLTALASASSLVGGVADLVSMFRGDYEIKARKVSIGTTPLFSALAKRLIEHDKKVNLEKLSLLEDSQLFKDFNAAAKARLEVQRLATKVKEKDLAYVDLLKEEAKAAQDTYEGAVKAAKAPKDEKDTLEALKDVAADLRGQVKTELGNVADARGLVAVAEDAIERFDEFAAAVTKAPESGYPPLVAAATREPLHNSPRTYTHVLYAALESAAGETITRRTIFSTTVRFLGGAQVSYMLWDVDAKKLVAADTMPVLGNVKFGLATGFAERVQAVPLKRGS